MQKLLIENGTIVDQGRRFEGYVLVEGERIAEVGEGSYCHIDGYTGDRIDATGKLVIPGLIDDQVHFREPGLTEKGDIHSESRAAVAGGVTSFMEMPNTRPPTTSQQEWELKQEKAAQVSAANYAFYFGATNDNIADIRRLDPKAVCGVKVFMGSSTGNMLVDDAKTLSAIFAESPVLVATHCEDEMMIRRQADLLRSRYGDNIEPAMHPLIRSAEACYRSSSQAAALADKYGTDLHILHISTARELSIFSPEPLSGKKITGEVCVHHLWFSDEDYASKGNMIKWNPAIKSTEDRDALCEALVSGRLDVAATDHAPHTLTEKERPYWDCPSGGPLVQHSLAAMLDLSRRGLFTVEQVVERMCHAPAERFGVRERGFLRRGYYADIAIVDRGAEWTVKKDNILYKCGWSPFEGTVFTDRVSHTIINGRVAYGPGGFDDSLRGMPLEFTGIRS